MNVLTIGQKIKKIRREISLPYHRVTQSELAGNGISKSSIGHLEKGDLKINNHLARVIIENASTIAKKNGKEFNYTVEWLMEDRKQEVHDLIRKHILELKSNPTDKQFESVKTKLDFLCSTEKVKSNQLFVIYDTYAKYYKNKNLNVVKGNLLKMYELANKEDNISQQLYVIEKFTVIYSLLEKWEDVITWGKVAISLSYKKYIKLFMKFIYFNMAMAYKMDNKFQECNKLLELLENNYSLNKSEKFDIDILRAHCFKRNKDFNSASEILYCLLEESQNENDWYKLSMAYVNIADLKYEANDIESISFMQKAFKIEFPNDLKFKFKQAEMLYTALKIYIKFKCDFKDIYEIFENLCAVSLITKEYNLQFKAISLVYNYNMYLQNSSLLKLLLTKLKNLQFNDSKKSILYFKILGQLYAINDKDFKNELLNGFNLANSIEI